ncbi:MAG: hypothetical protein CSA47_00980 [Gammaproteobacteria bacterium]|nr:MAG: hypothetical protein CSA47_00980 [Gammaproteobacteria bacterium]
MQYLIYAIICSVSVSVILKIAKKQSIVLEQAIAFNYLMAISLGLFLLKPAYPDDFSALPWPVFLALGVLLPSVFIIMGKAVEYAGIVKSDAAQRLSLILPIIAAVTLFGETLSTYRGIGVILAFVALFCLLIKPDTHKGTAGLSGALLLIGVWFGYGIIDILFKQLAKSTTGLPFNLVFAFILAGLLMFVYIFLRKQTITVKSVVGGLVLGVFNFFNILFYIKAHQAFSTNPTLVFAAMNIGVITLGTLTGWLVFKEKLRPVNVLGIVFAIAAILMLFYGVQLFPA